jgi:membrane-associated phospholipid phosphatase
VTKRIANLTSNIFSPFLIGLVIILLVSVEVTTSVFDAIKWSLILIALSVLPIFIFIVYLVRHNRLDGIFARSRNQRIRIYVPMAILASVSCIILIILQAPLMLLSLSIAGLSGTVVFMCINLWWKISLHTAFITAMVTILFILYGCVSMASIVLIPLIAWSRIKLGHHALSQTVTGALLGNIILVTVFYLFGLV